MITTILDWAPPAASESLMLITEKEVASFPVQLPCPICKSKESSIPAVEIGLPSWKTAVTLVQCSHCSHIYYQNPPSQDVINQFYNDSYKSENNDSDINISPLTKTVNHKLADLMADLGMSNSNASFFDVGCGDGGVMAGLQEHGFTNLQGCEIHPNRFNTAQQRFPNHVFLGGFDNIVMDQKFDIIYSNHVLEHIYNPKEMIDWKLRHLKDNGLIIINVPNAVFEPSIEQTLYLAHLHSFTKHSLQCLANSMELECRFWKSPYKDELSVIFFRDTAIWGKANLDKFYDVKTLEKNRCNANLISRLREPWISAPSNNAATLTHSPGGVNINTPFNCAGHWILFGWQAKFYEIICRLYWRFHNKEYVFPVWILPKLRSTIMSQENQLTGFGYMKIQTTDTSKEVPRLSWKNNAYFIIQ